MKKSKSIALALLAGGMMFNWGCLGGWINSIWKVVPAYVALEWLTDNDNVFDLFEDGNVG